MGNNNSLDEAFASHNTQLLDSYKQALKNPEFV